MEKSGYILLISIISISLILSIKGAINDIIFCQMTNREKKCRSRCERKVIKKKYFVYVPKIFPILYYTSQIVYAIAFMTFLFLDIENFRLGARVYGIIMLMAFLVFIILGYTTKKSGKSFIAYSDYSRYSKANGKRKKK